MMSFRIVKYHGDTNVQIILQEKRLTLVPKFVQNFGAKH